jgi:hypothetical protein
MEMNFCELIAIEKVYALIVTFKKTFIVFMGHVITRNVTHVCKFLIQSSGNCTSENSTFSTKIQDSCQIVYSGSGRREVNF